MTSSNSLKTKCKCDPAHLDQVVKWILTGASEHDIVEAIHEAYPDAAPPMLLKAAIASIENAADFDSKIVIGWCLEATRDMYRRMVTIGDFTGALRAVKQLAELARQNPPIISEPNGPIQS